jgi:hypothetical protein
MYEASNPPRDGASASTSQCNARSVTLGARAQASDPPDGRQRVRDGPARRGPPAACAQTAAARQSFALTNRQNCVSLITTMRCPLFAQPLDLHQLASRILAGGLECIRSAAHDRGGARAWRAMDHGAGAARGANGIVAAAAQDPGKGQMDAAKRGQLAARSDAGGLLSAAISSSAVS